MFIFKHLFNRVAKSAVLWSWTFNAVRLASGLILLPLLIRQLSTEELGMYYVFLSLLALVPIIDFGFNPAIARFVSYAMAGATKLQAHGHNTSSSETSSSPNFPLLWQLLRTTRQLYGWLATIGFLVIGIWGTWLVSIRVHECPSPNHVWLAWIATLCGMVFEIYSTWWNTFLYATNNVPSSARISLSGYALRIALACILLAGGAGLLSAPIGAFVGCLLNRVLSRRACLRVLGPQLPRKAEEQPLFRLLWPNSWRTGLQFMSGYLRANANTAICVSAFGLAATAEYGLSLQVVMIAVGMSSVWTQVKWPSVGQYRTRGDYDGLQRMLRPRALLQFSTYLLLAGGVVLVLPELLEWAGSDKKMLPLTWLLLLALNAFFELNFNFWGTLISTENRLPFLWPTIATNAVSLILTLCLVHWTSLGIGALVLGPLISGSVFNYWYWSFAGARSVRTTLPGFIFGTRAAKQ